MRLYIIRHGQTLWNTTYQLQGQTDIPLNDEGRLLAVRTGRALKAVRFDAVYSSPLARASETARLVLSAAADGRPTPPVITDPRLSEISFGVMEGQCIRDRDGRITDENFERFFYDPEHYLPPKGGESFQELTARTGDFLDELSLREEESTVLVSAHGACSRALLANMTRCPLRDFWSGGVPKNCAVTVAELKDGRWQIKEKDKIYYDDEDI